MENQEKLQVLEKCEALLAAGKTEEALKELINIANRKYRSQFIRLSNQLKRLERQYTNGMIDNDQYQAGQNRVSVGLMNAMQEFEAELKGEKKKDVPMLIKGGIGVGIAIIAALVWSQVAGLSKPDCTTDQSRVGIYIADFLKDENDILSGRILQNIRDRGLSNTYHTEKTTYLSDEDRENAVSEILADCDTTGLIINGTLNTNSPDPEKWLVNCYINLVNFKLKVPQLSVGDTVLTLNSPSNIDFDIDTNSDFVARFVEALIRAFEGESEQVIALLQDLQNDPLVEKSEKLNATVEYYIGVGQAMNGNPIEAHEHFDKAVTLPKFKQGAEENKQIAKEVFIQKLERRDDNRQRALQYIREKPQVVRLILEDRRRTDTVSSILVELLNQPNIRDSIQQTIRNNPEMMAEFLLERIDQKDVKGSASPTQRATKLVFSRVTDLPEVKDYIATLPVEKKSVLNKMVEIGHIDQLPEEDETTVPPNPTKENRPEEPPSKVEGTFSDRDGNTYAFKTMKDGKRWMTQSLNITIDGSYCYENKPENCRKYGRLYTFETAKEGCRLLGNGWRLPTDEEWREMAKKYGGVDDDANDGGKAAYDALLEGGDSGFAALLGGKRYSDGSYLNLGTYGLYWTSTEYGSNYAWYYSFSGGKLWRNGNDYSNRTYGRSVRCLQDN